MALGGNSAIFVLLSVRRLEEAISEVNRRVTLIAQGSSNEHPGSHSVRFAAFAA